ncbi:M16 family metallopeptidase [Indioceanicola profundi]|uniref:M16 family metallopeptidase n=1 Tax=Indioceanicola profundi TaxID=2220096 RepID=UPI000E6ACC69|nr:pitrilysin family protein [Indioceanicola profundi]
MRRSPRSRNRLAALAAAAFLSATALATTPARAEIFNPETFTLANGMKVVVVTNERAPVVSHMVWYKVGSADDPPGKSGIAHVLEHLMFKGTDEIQPGEFSRTIARNGGQDNAFTSWDYTGYYQNIARDRLELVMKMESDRMTDLQLTPEIVAPEIKVVMEERNQRTENDPAARLREQLWAMLFVHHPYGTPIIGWMHEIAALDQQDALDFYKSWYAPNNAILIVSGDVTAAELKPLAESTYGKTPAGKVPERVRTTEPPTEGERRIILRDPQVQQPSWQRVWKAPSYNQGATEHAYALQVLETVVSGGATARLYRNLVVEDKAAAGVSMFYSPSAYDLGTLGVSATPLPGGDVETVEKAVEAELAELLRDGVTAEEVETAKKRMVREAIFARDSLQGPAYIFGLGLTTGQTVEDVEAWPDRIAAVTVEQVNAAARAVLSQNGHVTGVLLPDVQTAEAPAAPAAGEKSR